MKNEDIKRPEELRPCFPDQAEPVSGKREAPRLDIGGVAASPCNGVFAQRAYGEQKAIPEKIYPVIDTDLGRDNIQNDISSADLTELS